MSWTLEGVFTLIELIDFISIYRELKKDTWGIPVLSEVPEIVNCRIMYSLGYIELTLGNGDKVGVAAKVYFEGIFQIGAGDELEFIDDFGNIQRLKAIDVKPIKDFSGEVLYTRVTV